MATGAVRLGIENGLDVDRDMQHERIGSARIVLAGEPTIIGVDPDSMRRGTG